MMLKDDKRLLFNLKGISGSSVYKCRCLGSFVHIQTQRCFQHFELVIYEKNEVYSKF